MTPLPARLLLATALALSAAAGQAATLGLSAGAPVITGTGDVLYVPGTDLAFVGSDADGLDISAVAALDVSGDLIPGVDPGALLVDAALSATVAAAGFEIDGGTDGGDVIELLLEVGDGDLGATLGAQALAVLTGEFGTTDAFAASDFASPASIAISPLTSATPVPIPAGGLLLVSGLVVLTTPPRQPRILGQRAVPDAAKIVRAPPEQAEIETRRLGDQGAVPNNPDLPVLWMRGVIARDAGAAAIRALLEANGWGGTWAWTVFDYHHYHPNAHEVLVVAAGWADLTLGGPGGETVHVAAGDALVLPAGTGHCRARAAPGFEVCGAYPPGQEDYDTLRANDRRAADLPRRIAGLPRPETDPVYGAEGPLTLLWRDGG